MINKTSSGSLVFNDTYMQLAVYEMPFGGHGESGCAYDYAFWSPYADRCSTCIDGAYFDKETFDLFTHRRSYINVPAAYVFSTGHL